MEAVLCISFNRAFPKPKTFCTSCWLRSHHSPRSACTIYRILAHIHHRYAYVCANIYQALFMISIFRLGFIRIHWKRLSSVRWARWFQLSVLCVGAGSVVSDPRVDQRAGSLLCFALLSLAWLGGWVSSRRLRKSPATPWWLRGNPTYPTLPYPTLPYPTAVCLRHGLLGNSTSLLPPGLVWAGPIHASSLGVAWS